MGGEIRRLDAILKRDPGDTANRELRAALYLMRSRKKTARSGSDLRRAELDYAEVLKQLPQRVAALYGRGICRYLQAQIERPPVLQRRILLEGAIADMTEAIRLDPTNLDYLVRRASMRISLAAVNGGSSLDEAEIHRAKLDWEAVLKVAPGEGAGLWGLAGTLDLLAFGGDVGRTPERTEAEGVVKAFEEAIAAAPGQLSLMSGRIGRAWLVLAALRAGDLAGRIEALYLAVHYFATAGPSDVFAMPGLERLIRAAPGLGLEPAQETLGLILGRAHHALARRLDKSGLDSGLDWLEALVRLDAAHKDFPDKTEIAQELAEVRAHLRQLRE